MTKPGKGALGGFYLYSEEVEIQNQKSDMWYILVAFIDSTCWPKEGFYLYFNDQTTNKGAMESVSGPWRVVLIFMTKPSKALGEFY